jgi:hypothetical protein
VVSEHAKAKHLVAQRHTSGEHMTPRKTSGLDVDGHGVESMFQPLSVRVCSANNAHSGDYIALVVANLMPLSPAIRSAVWVRFPMRACLLIFTAGFEISFLDGTEYKWTLIETANMQSTGKVSVVTAPCHFTSQLSRFDCLVMTVQPQWSHSHASVSGDDCTAF